ncbi:MAG TPA: fibronectin type III domain-containing protein [Solirubrobacteraceae bacterium]|nr:fibronectin type III domain-containing protein [Solirubrobacteraceae bacterium]
MKRTTKLIVAAVILAVAITGVAAAASSPTVSTRAATKIHNFSAKLNGVVNPNGSRTGYVFQYGLTTAYGLQTSGHNAGAGTKDVAASATIAGLSPGTVYHYRVVALNRLGSTTGADRTLKTTGPPPPGVATGPPVSVGKTTATVTGTVSTNGAATTWLVQFGLTTGYGAQTFGQVIPNSGSPTAVSVQLTGLTPGKMFHYRLVGLHSGKVVSDGNDGTFFTEPATRAKTRVSARTKPSHDRHSPFVFTTNGTVHGGSSMPAAVRCTGTVRVRYFRGRRRISSGLASLAPTCTFSTQVKFRHLRGHGAAKLRIAISFPGNGYIAPSSRSNTVTVR